MKLITFYTLVLLVFLSACGEKQTNNENAIKLDSPNGIYNPKEMDQFLEKSKFSKDQRISTIKNLQEAFKQKYIGYTIKEKLIGKSPDKIFSDCIDRESKSKDKMFAFEFNDHILLCLAELRDTHVGVKNSHSTVATYISRAMLVNNKLIITSLRDELIRKMDENSNENSQKIKNYLSAGDEILSIDGKNIDEAISEIEKYISNSSNLERRNLAVASLFQRDFYYPTQKTITVKLKKSKSEIIQVDLPWFIDGRQSTTLDSIMHLKKLGIGYTKELNIKNSTLDASGFSLKNKIFDKIDRLKFYKDTSGNDFARIGAVSTKDKKFCYMQILNFDLGKKGESYLMYDNEDENKRELSSIDIFKQFLTFCEKSKQDLVLDLKSNNGGDLNLGLQFFSLFETTSNIYYAKSRNLQFGNQNFIFDIISEISETEASIIEDLNFSSAFSAQNKNQPVSDWILTRDSTHIRGVFSRNVILLTSSKCVSTCDSVANAFKLSKRSLIVGEPTNGAILGYSSTNNVNSDYTDTFGLIKLIIPNEAFQIINVSDDSHFIKSFRLKMSILDFNKLEILENNPVTPDVTLHLTENDLTNNFADYKIKVLELVQSK